MGGAESVPRDRQQQRSSRADLLALQEKYDNFRITEDRETDSMIVDRNMLYTGHDPVSSRQTHVSGAKTEALIHTILQDPKNRLALSALSAANPALVLERPSAILRDTQTFNVAIPLEGSPVTNQRSSGRCWIFAATNVLRVAIMKKYNIEKFELSQAYLFFWDKVEKSNFFLESILETADLPVDDRLVTTLMSQPVSDGGQWSMIQNLVEKYGLVPQTLYPDSFNAQNSATMDHLLTTKLREDALRLRALRKSGSSTAATSVAAAKEQMMQDIIRILTLTLGQPPSSYTKFTWEFYDKAKKLQTVKMSPKEFAGSLNDSHARRALGGTDVHSLFSLVNDPRNEYNRLLSVNFLSNMSGGKYVEYVNVDKPIWKKAAIEMLEKGFPVFFGSDVGKFSDSKLGIMDPDLVDYELGFNVKLGMSKAERLMTGESAMTHAMVLTAVHLSPSGEPIRWRVENSWSETAGTKGYFVMSDKWMNEFCYQVVVDPSCVSQDVRDILKQEPKVLNLWDPMGVLA
ncbi:peptidase C1B, bleomycin hydrolase [Aureobasidium subglaciale]|nr:peptidase C1B, bleomycin hydrolase [Aureobasidium subglaciale]